MKEHKPEVKKQDGYEHFREQTKVKFEHFFDEGGIDSRLDYFISQLEILERNGLIFNREEISRGLRESIGIKDRTEFVSHILKVLEPLMLLKFTKPREFENSVREVATSSDGKIKLSEVLSASFDDKKVEIHLAPASELIKDGGIRNFKREVESGLTKLAEIVSSTEKIEEIWATSWIVAKNPLLLQKLGFTLHSQVSKEEAERDYNGDTRSLARAFINRKDFLARYFVKK